MPLDTAEVSRISERLIALGNRSKMLASYIAVQAADNVICSEMGFRPHELVPAISKLCDELEMQKLDQASKRLYIRSAVLYVVPPPPPPPPPLPKIRIRLKKLSPEERAEVESLAVSYLRASQRTTDPLLAEVLSITPQLLRFAVSLARDIDAGEELLQEALTRAYANLKTFQPGPNVRASVKSWLFMILKNLFRSNLRSHWREIEDPEGAYQETLQCPPNQIDFLEMQEASSALGKLPEEQRQAVILVGLRGFSYEEAADMCNCAVGTIKSRINRGRIRVAELIGAQAKDGRPGATFLAHGPEDEEVSDSGPVPT